MYHNTEKYLNFMQGQHKRHNTLSEAVFIEILCSVSHTIELCTAAYTTIYQ